LQRQSCGQWQIALGALAAPPENHWICARILWHDRCEESLRCFPQGAGAQQQERGGDTSVRQSRNERIGFNFVVAYHVAKDGFFLPRDSRLSADAGFQKAWINRTLRQEK
jgi:hypothetical protein